MKNLIRSPLLTLTYSLFASCLLGACATETTQNATSMISFLYPEAKNPVVIPSTSKLDFPLRVGIAFVPIHSLNRNHGFPASSVYTSFQDRSAALSEKRRAELIQAVADSFRQYPFIKDTEIIPSAYLRPGGSFVNLELISSMYSVDVIALLSYDQVQFIDEVKPGLTYWTIAGAYSIPGEKNDTQTLLEVAVYDVLGRKMLFRAPGQSLINGTTILLDQKEGLHTNSGKGFDEAAKNLILNLDKQLTLFKEEMYKHPE